VQAINGHQLFDADVIAMNIAACHGGYRGWLSLAQRLTV